MKAQNVHTEEKTEFSGAPDSARLADVFAGCGDYEARRVLPGLMPGEGVTLCWLDGLVDGTAVSEDVLRPLTEAGRVVGAMPKPKLVAEISKYL